MSTADRVGFGATLGSEWIKITSQRSVRVTLACAVLLGMVVTGLLGWVVLATWPGWPAAERADFDPVDTSLIGTLLVAILVTVLGVTVVSSEYSSRMIALTLTATPRRERVLLAKVLVVAALAVATSVVSIAGMELVGLVLYSRLDAPPVDGSDAALLLLGSVASAPVLPVIAVCLAFLLRSAAGSVAAMLGLVLGPAFFGPLLPHWWAEHGQRYLPTAASDSLFLPRTSPELTLDPWVAALTLALWLAVFLGGAAVVLGRRDA
jgi:ABC-2 type transport system permease protein